MCMLRPTVSLHSAGKKRDKLKCNFPNMRTHCMTNGSGTKKIKVNKEYSSCVFDSAVLLLIDSFPLCAAVGSEDSRGCVSCRCLERKASPRARRNVVQPAC